MGKILFRYVCREVTAPFLVGLLIFTLILFAARMLKLVELAVNRGIPLSSLLKIFLYVLPAFLEVTVPMAFLLALLWSFGRLAADREITALKSCGLSLYQLSLPVWLVAIILLSGSFFLTLHVRPWSNAALKRVFYDITKTHATAGLKEKTFNSDFDGLVIYAEEIQPPGTFLRGVMIADSREPHRKNTIFAHQGIVIPNEEQRLLTLRLLNGTVHTARSPQRSYQTTQFAVYDVTLNLATVLSKIKEPDRDPQDRPLSELRQVILQKQATQTDHKRELVEWHRRFSLPFACIVFSLLALPLSTQTRWTLRAHGFAVSLSVIFSYYLLLTVGEACGKKGILPPALALWLPNLVLGSVGLYLFLRAGRGHSFFSFPTRGQQRQWVENAGAMHVTKGEIP